MAIASEHVLNQAVVDVQYTRGSLYFDKCGSLLLKLEEVLGPPFEGAVAPTMLNGELTSTVERLAVQFGPTKANVTQMWTRLPTRVEQIAPMMWEQVASTLDVTDRVTRLGVRFILLWKVDSMEEGRERVAKCQLLRFGDDWESIAGKGTVVSWAAVTENDRGRLRIGVDVLETRVQGTLGPDLADIVPTFAVLLDLDHVYPGTPPFSLQKGAMKDFIRASWQRTKTAAKTFRQRLGDEIE